MDFDLAIDIERPPHDVYAMLADVQDFATGPGSPVTLMEKTPAGPTAVGTRWREVVRLMPGLAMTTRTTAALVEPDRRLGLDWTAPGMHGRILYTMESVGGGTRLRQEEDVRTHGWLRPFAGPVRRILGPKLHARLADIKELLESGGAALSSP